MEIAIRVGIFINLHEGTVWKLKLSWSQAGACYSPMNLSARPCIWSCGTKRILHAKMCSAHNTQTVFLQGAFLNQS